MAAESWAMERRSTDLLAEVPVAVIVAAFARPRPKAGQATPPGLRTAVPVLAKPLLTLDVHNLQLTMNPAAAPLSR
jgi:hypothetical protein